MNRIDNKFVELKEIDRKALITFVTAGDPDLATTIRLVLEMEKQGADIIELGIPYSDPIAEGPVIQKANERALSKGIRIIDIMNTVAEIRKVSQIPMLYLLYYNCILQYGIERFFTDCVNCGLDGLIIPDLPFEEQEEIQEIAEQMQIRIITLVSPTSRDRISKIAQSAKGFIYCVSSLGVTGVRSTFNTNFDEFMANINSVSSTPKAIGFGISTPEHIEALKDYAEGLIVGSAIVKKIGEAKNSDEAVNVVGAYVSELRKAL